MSPLPSTCRGVALVECLVAMLLVALAAVGLGLLQQRMRDSADAARQQGEANRLALAKLDEWGGITPADGVLTWHTLRDGEDSPDITSNARYRRRWTVQPDAQDRFRRVQVDVEWRDPRGEARVARLMSLVARQDPRDRAALVLPPPPDRAVRRAAAHPAGVPIDAIRWQARQGRRASALTWPGARRGWILFDELDGAPAWHCDEAPHPELDLAQACERLGARWLEGYLLTSARPDDLRPMLEQPRGHDDTASADCVLETTPFDPPIADGLSPRLALRYRCLVPIDDAANAAWTGRVIWQGMAPGQHACRYLQSDDATTTAADGTYTQVSGSLRHRNFLLMDTADCPEGTTAHPSSTRSDP